MTIDTKLRAELRAAAMRELSIARSALRAAIADGAPDLERGELRAAIRRCESDIESLRIAKAVVS